MYGPEYLDWQDQRRVDGLVECFLAGLDVDDRKRVDAHFEKKLLRLLDQQRYALRLNEESLARSSARLSLAPLVGPTSPLGRSPFDTLGFQSF